METIEVKVKYLYYHISNSSFIIANKLFVKISSMMGKMDYKGSLKASSMVSKGFHLLVNLKYDGPNIFLKTFCRSFSDQLFFTKCITTFWPGFRLLQASILHQLKGEGHVVNLREQENSAVVGQVCPLQRVTALRSPSVRSSRGWGRSCTEEQNNPQAAPSATPSTPHRRTTQTNKQTNTLNVAQSLIKSPTGCRSCWHSSPVFPALSPPDSACSSVCWQRWWETGNAIKRSLFPGPKFALSAKEGNITVFTTFSLSGAWSNRVSKASLSVGTKKWSGKRPSKVSLFVMLMLRSRKCAGNLSVTVWKVVKRKL